MTPHLISPGAAFSAPADHQPRLPHRNNTPNTPFIQHSRRDPPKSTKKDFEKYPGG
jgi:hypothetical protein